MAFQHFEYANPMENILGALKGGQEFAYNRKMNPLLIEMQKYKNQYEGQRAPFYPQLVQAQLAKAQAEPGEIRAHASALSAQAGLHGVETKEKTMMLKYLQDKMRQAQSQQRNSQGQGQGQGQGGGYGGGDLDMAHQGGGIMQGEGYGGMQQPSQSSQNSVYGIATPEPTIDDIMNQKMLGIDTFSPRRDNAKLQQEDQYKQYQESMANTMKAAEGANSMNQLMGMFDNAWKRSSYKGQLLGHVPTEAIFGNATPEQQTDRIASLMMPDAIATLKDSMGAANFSNMDMGFAARMKFDRTMNQETLNLQKTWMGAVNHRMQEKAKFMTLVSNPQSNLTKNQAEQLWQSYQQDLPLYDEKTGRVEPKRLDKWWFYTTPKAIQSLKNTGSYHISKEELNTIPMRLPDNRIVPIKKSQHDNAYKQGARDL
jgi:hypothetical protein